MALPEPLATYLELRESTPEGEEGAGLSHKAGGLVLLHVLELASHGEPRGGVTFVHDAGDHGGRYVAAARELAEGGWAVALPDLRGHGKSEGERGHSNGIKEVLRDLDAVQDHLAYRLPIAPKALIGCGLGALYAQCYALERPDAIAALVLLSPRWRPRFGVPKPPAGLFKAFKKLDPRSPGQIGNDPARLTSDPAEQQAWRSDPLVHDAISVRAAAQASELAAQCETTLPSVAAPVLLLHGRDDSLSDPSVSSRAAGPNVTVDLVDGAAHDLLHERNASTTLARIRAWLADRI
jgi:acylglycerol lipase